MAKGYYKGKNPNGGYGKRRTGCSERTYKNKHGETRRMIRAFRPDPFTKSGFQNAIAVPQIDSRPKSGNDAYENWVVTITDSMGKRTFNGVYNVKKNIVSIPDLFLVMSPNGKGSFGSPSRK